MKKRIRTASEVKQDKANRLDTMSHHKPRDNEKEWFERKPYSKTIGGGDIGEGKTNEQPEV